MEDNTEAVVQVLNQKRAPPSNDAFTDSNEPRLKKNKKDEKLYGNSSINEDGSFNRCSTPPATHPASPDFHRVHLNIYKNNNGIDDTNTNGHSKTEMMISTGNDNSSNSTNGEIPNGKENTISIASTATATTTTTNKDIENNSSSNDNSSENKNNDNTEENSNIVGKKGIKVEEKLPEPKYSFVVVRNDGTEDNIILLMNAKKIFATQKGFDGASEASGVFIRNKNHFF